MIQVMIDPPNFAFAAVSDVQGGKLVHIQINKEVVDAFNWVMKYRKTLETEIELRNSIPALASQWDQYQTMLRIVMDDV